ncbi:MAG: TPM domain-containing protein [Candidatus Eremiobacteraeota bacterium]|nr:TPM domain-containing protein [Candidatus Eremiobacteraeota bacterium]
MIALVVWASVTYVTDGASMLSKDTIARVNQINAALSARTGKSVLVITGTAAGAHTDANSLVAASRSSAAVVYIAGTHVQIGLSPEVRRFFSPAVTGRIGGDLSRSVRSGQADAGTVDAVGEIADRIAGGASGGHGPAPARVIAAQERWNYSGSDGSWLWWILGFIGVLVLIRVAFARRTEPRAGAPS